MPVEAARAAIHKHLRRLPRLHVCTQWFGHIDTRIRRIAHQQDGQSRAHRRLVAQFVRQAVNASGTRRGDVQFAQRCRLHRRLRLRSSGSGFALRDALTAGAVQQLVQCRLRGAHLPVSIAGGSTRTIHLGHRHQFAFAQTAQAHEVGTRIKCLRLHRRKLGAGLRDLFAARAGTQFGQGLAALPRLRLHRVQLRTRAGDVQLQQTRTGRHLLAFAHINGHDFFCSGCRQGDAVPFQGAQHLRRWLAAGAKQRNSGDGEQGFGLHHGCFHSIPTPRSSSASVCRRSVSISRSSASKSCRQIGAPAIGNRVRPTSETISKRGSKPD